MSIDLTMKASSLSYSLRKEYVLHLMVLPSVVAYLIFMYVPMYGVVMAFQDYKILDGYFGSRWVGLKHFGDFFNDVYFVRLIRNTFLLGVYSLATLFPATIVFALLLKEIANARLKRVYQSICYLPYFIPVVVLVGIIHQIFGADGVVNSVLESFGIAPQRFLTQPRYFRPLYVGSEIWQDLGWGSIVYLAAMASISPVLYEAATIDGAGRFRRIWHITLPGITPTIVILFILQVGSVLKVGFEKVFLLYTPSTYKVADVLSTYVYRRGLINLDYSYAAAVDVFNNVTAMILLLSANYLSRRINQESLF